jgi:hypothetical protein
MLRLGWSNAANRLRLSASIRSNWIRCRSRAVVSFKLFIVQSPQPCYWLNDGASCTRLRRCRLLVWSRRLRCNRLLPHHETNWENNLTTSSGARRNDSVVGSLTFRYNKGDNFRSVRNSNRFMINFVRPDGSNMKERKQQRQKLV